MPWRDAEGRCGMRGICAALRARGICFVSGWQDHIKDFLLFPECYGLYCISKARRSKRGAETLSVSQSFLSVSTSSFVTVIYVRPNLVYRIVATYIVYHSLLNCQSHRSAHAQEDTHSSDTHHQVPTVAISTWSACTSSLAGNPSLQITVA
jgi:hypothetical protein